MSAKKSLFAAVIAVCAAAIATDAEAFGWRGTWGSHGGWGTHGSWGTWGSHGSWGGGFARRGFFRGHRTHGSWGGTFGTWGSHGGWGTHGSWGTHGGWASHGSWGGGGVIHTGVAPDFVRSEARPARTFVRSEGRPVRNFVQRRDTRPPLAEDQSAVRTSLTIHVPADAKVTLAGVETKQTGEVRRFSTTRLAPGQNWDDYAIVVELEHDGQTLREEHTVTLVGGRSQELAVDFDARQIARL